MSANNLERDITQLYSQFNCNSENNVTAIELKTLEVKIQQLLKEALLDLESKLPLNKLLRKWSLICHPDKPLKNDFIIDGNLYLTATIMRKLDRIFSNHSLNENIPNQGKFFTLLKNAAKLIKKQNISQFSMDIQKLLHQWPLYEPNRTSENILIITPKSAQIYYVCTQARIVEFELKNIFYKYLNQQNSSKSQNYSKLIKELEEQKCLEHWHPSKLKQYVHDIYDKASQTLTPPNPPLHFPQNDAFIAYNLQIVKRELYKIQGSPVRRGLFYFSSYNEDLFIKTDKPNLYIQHQLRTALYYILYADPSHHQNTLSERNVVLNFTSEPYQWKQCQKLEEIFQLNPNPELLKNYGLTIEDIKLLNKTLGKNYIRKKQNNLLHELSYIHRNFNEFPIDPQWSKINPDGSTFFHRLNWNNFWDIIKNSYYIIPFILGLAEHPQVILLNRHSTQAKNIITLAAFFFSYFFLPFQFFYQMFYISSILMLFNKLLRPLKLLEKFNCSTVPLQRKSADKPETYNIWRQQIYLVAKDIININHEHNYGIFNKIKLTFKAPIILCLASIATINLLLQQLEDFFMKKVFIHCLKLVNLSSFIYDRLQSLFKKTYITFFDFFIPKKNQNDAPSNNFSLNEQEQFSWPLTITKNWDRENNQNQNLFSSSFDNKSLSLPKKLRYPSPMR
jgi:hypothetical protein